MHRMWGQLVWTTFLHYVELTGTIRTARRQNRNAATPPPAPSGPAGVATLATVPAMMPNSQIPAAADATLDDIWDAIAAGVAADAARPTVSATMVSSLDGRAAMEGRSGRLAGPADALVFAMLRATADAVVVGRSTAAIEGYGPLKLNDQAREWRVSAGRAPLPVLVVCTAGGGDVMGVPAVASGDAIVACTATTAAHLRDVVPSDRLLVVNPDTDGNPDNAHLVDVLQREYGPRIVMEGGPRLLTAFLAADLVTDLDLTIASRLVGIDAPPLITGPMVDSERWTLRRLHVVDGDVFTAYRRNYPAHTPPETA